MSFVIYQSSAGSGKTFTLVKEYLKIVIENPEKFRHILAVTFTNKAANEMKARVLSRLKDLADKGSELKGDPMFESLKHETGLDEGTISERALIVLEFILHNYSEFAIGTIDSFMYKVIRTFAHDLKIPLNFDVELDTKQFTQQAIDVLISQVGHDKDLTKALLKFIESKTDKESSWKIENDLQKFTSVMMRDESFPYLKSLKELEIKDIIRIDNELRAWLRKFESGLSVIAERAIQLIQEQDLTPACFSHGNNGIYGYLRKLAFKDFTTIKPGIRVQNTGNSEDWSPKKGPVDEKLRLALIQPDLIRIFENIQQYFDQGYQDYVLFNNIRKHIYPIAVLNEIEKVIDEFRESENLIHISEFNRRISEIVSTEPIPFIYERLGERYQHYLVDEFQDTSYLQWHNLIPLFENSLGYGSFNMVVGDEKQAIYRWRGGDAEQFVNLPGIKGAESDEMLRQREEVLVSHGEKRNLDTNFRSGTEIVAFNNDFFEYVKGTLPVGKQGSFSNVKQKWIKEKTGGYIRIDFFTGKKKSDYEQETLNRIQEIVLELQEDRYKLEDITILCRTNRQASLIARYLSENQINVISSESLLLSASPAVNFLLAALQYISNPHDSIARTEILKFLIDAGHLSGNSFPLALSHEHDEGKEEFIGIHFPLQKLLNLPLYELIEELIRRFGLNKKFDPYIQFFLDTTIDYTTKRTGTITDFLDWWSENDEKHSIIVSEGQEAVQVMTIHKAKGLEFPVVIYPFVDRSFSRDQMDNVWVEIDHVDIPDLKASLLDMNKDLLDTPFSDTYNDESEQAVLDSVNLLYVAMTRPTRRLYLMSKQMADPKQGAPTNVSQLLSDYLKQKGVWRQDILSYEFGDKKTIPDPENKKESGMFNLEGLVSEDWRERLLISTKAPEIWDLDDPDKNREWGNLVHHLLSKVEYHDDCDGVIQDAMTQGLINSSGADIIKGWFDEMMQQPDLSSFFTREWKVKNEAEIFQKGKSYRPDRLVFKGKDVVVMDYKTGKPKQEHKKQIEWYGKVIERMGYIVQGRYLVYIGDRLQVIKV